MKFSTFKFPIYFSLKWLKSVQNASIWLKPSSLEVILIVWNWSKNPQKPWINPFSFWWNFWPSYFQISNQSISILMLKLKPGFHIAVILLIRSVIFTDHYFPVWTRPLRLNSISFFHCSFIVFALFFHLFLCCWFPVYMTLTLKEGLRGRAHHLDQYNHQALVRVKL